ncbi:MAG TPA: DUF1549 and DUF1553 domain-containing protein [Verrucomicrobiae bacterium]|nr:DUF1549 and DUF1553 domain-containing protein [Verrucomicrobiae bacterium]
MRKPALTCGLLLATAWLLPGFEPAGHAAPGQSFEAASRHWAYQPLNRPQPPQVTEAQLVQSPIDAFLLSKLEQKHLSFAPATDRRTLLRRVYFDLVGLPPTVEEVQAFEQDGSTNAFAKVVDRLLDSPRYGECWGRHWLDVARYADTKDLVLAYGKDALRPYAYTYRDYVIRAFNEDLPYDQFVEDQLAADLIPGEPKWRLAALGFLTLGRLFDNNPHDQIDDQIDTTTRGFLALTVACARCHDHKYDAITQADYYGLYGVFASTERPYQLPLIEDPKDVPGGPEFERELAKARNELEQQIDSEYAKLTENFRQRIGDYLLRAGTTEPDITETSQFALSLTPDDFRPTLVLRTRRYLREQAVPGNKLFGLWSQLMALSEADLPSKAQEILDQAAKSEPPPNPLVLDALKSSVLTNKPCVAKAYGKLLRDIYEQSKKPVAGNPSGDLTADQRELLDVVTGPQSPIAFPRRDTPDHMSRPDKDRYNGLVANLDKIAANATNPPPARAMVVADLPQSFEPHIFKRGNPSRPGDAVPRAFVRVLTGGTALVFTNGSGRLELATAITSNTNPLTARVLVNRVWMHHFGEPLVASPADFGARSEAPANPQLLDWLASEFVRSGWSIKHLHRVILLSSAYQQASFPQAAQDPENTLLSHFPRRRLDFEAMRDSLLSAAGRLNLAVGGRSVDLAEEPSNTRRTVYALINRQDLPSMFRAFDFPVPDQCIERRPHTSVPQQALFAMNSPFVLQQARALAAMPCVSQTFDPGLKVAALFSRVFQRQPTPKEIASSLRLIKAAEQEKAPDNGLTAWEQLAQVLLMSNEAVFVD